MSKDQMTPEEQKAYLRARKKVGEMREFYGHLATYVVVISGLILLNLLTSSFPWVLFAMLGWGIGLFFHAMEVFGDRFFLGRDWEERKIQEIMARERGEKAKRGGTLRSEEADADPYFDFADIGDDGELATTRIRNQER